MLQVVSGFYYVRWLGGAALLVYLAGLVTLCWGWAVLRWAAPALGFLVFMVPLPYRYEALLSLPLKQASTRASATALQMLGVPAVPEGNLIVLNNVHNEVVELGVVDACSGLKMLMVFVCLATAVALLVRRPLGDRVWILLSAAPIALVCNVARITTTGLLHATVGSKWANLVFHDLAGWLMMPLALGLLWCELALLARLFPGDVLAPSGPRVVPLTVGVNPAPVRLPAAGGPRAGR